MMKKWLNKGLKTTLLAAFAPITAFATTELYKPLTTIPGAFTENVPVDPVSVVKNIYGVSIGIAAILAIIMIIWAGVEYSTTEAIEGKSGAKEKWQGALWGLGILLGAFIILRTINISLVNIDLSSLETPCSKSGIGVSCGSAVTGSLSQINTLAQLGSVALQQAQKQVASAQSAVTSLQAQKDLINQQLSKITNQASPEARALVAQADALDTQIAKAQQAVNTAQASVASQSVVTESGTALSTVIGNAIKNNDLDTAQRLAQDARALMLQNIQKMQSLGASPSDIAIATTKMNATNVFVDKTIAVANTLNSMDQPNRNGSTQWYSSDVISTRNQIISDVNAISATAISKDPSGQDTYKAAATSIITEMDNKLAKNLGCPKGLDISTNKISCAQ